MLSSRLSVFAYFSLPCLTYTLHRFLRVPRGGTRVSPKFTAKCDSHHPFLGGSCNLISFYGSALSQSLSMLALEGLCPLNFPLL